ncbi:MAG: LacI family DNA-binding transcriptional regulator [Anaerolineae bacterium]|nr:LacI family DNA-binding transcriptional regulator [Anaerolineae bacterium]
MHDIAKQAGVSPATVSRVLNNYAHVSQKKRARVMAVIESMEYRPSYTARSMRTQRSRLIGFIADQVATTPYAGDIIRGAQDVAWETNHILMVISTGDDLNHVQQAVDALLDREVEGIIFAAMYHRPVTVPPNIYEVPTVLANCFVEDRSLPCVVPDEVRGGYEATCELLKRGHRRIGFINVFTVTPGIPASRGRLAGYRQALAEYDVPFDEALVCFGYGAAEHGYDHTKQLMSLDNPPTALFCGNDRMAMGAYDALHKLHLEIPDDVAIIGYDNQEIIAMALHPKLSTMQLPHYAMGHWAADYLTSEEDADEVGETPVQRLLPCPFVERESLG